MTHIETQPLTLTPSQLAQAMEIAISADEPILIEGAPGIGKSAIVRQVVEKLGYEFIDIRLPLLDPVDLRGIPQVIDNVTRWARPTFIPATDYQKPTFLFFDEITAAPPAMQAAAYQIFLDRQLGEHKLPANCRLGGAGNRQKDKAVAHRVSTALRGRFINVTMETTVQDWIKWAFSAQIDPIVMAYIRAVPQALHEQAEDSTGISPTPRTWHKVSNIRPQTLPKEIRAQMIAGLVGQARALEFCGYLDLFPQMIHPDTCIAKPDSAPIPQNAPLFWMLGTSLISKATPGNVEAIMHYMSRYPQEYQAAFIPDLADKEPSLTMTRRYIAWANDHGNLILN